MQIEKKKFRENWRIFRWVEKTWIGLWNPPKRTMLQKAIVTQARTNGFLLLFGLINLLIWIYFYFQKPIVFEAIGWFPIPENIHWYQIFLVLIILRMLISFTMKYLTEYIKNLSLWTKKKKQRALYILAAINLFTLPISLPLIGAFYAYIQNKEILFNHWFLGTFRRILTEKERTNLYEETVKNFLEKLEKLEVTNGIKDEIKKWAIENSKTMLEKYDAGSVFATKYVSEQLENKKEFFQKIQNQKGAIKIEEIVEQQGYWPWIYEKTTNAVNIFNPCVTDYTTCAIAWIALVAVSFLIFTVSKSHFRSWETKQEVTDVKNTLKANDLKIDNNQINVNMKIEKNQIDIKNTLKALDRKIDKNQINVNRKINNNQIDVKNTLKALDRKIDKNQIDVNLKIDKNQIDVNLKIDKNQMAANLKIDKNQMAANKVKENIKDIVTIGQDQENKIDMHTEAIKRLRKGLGRHEEIFGHLGIKLVTYEESTTGLYYKKVFPYLRWSPEKKNELIRRLMPVFKKYENQGASMQTAQEMLKDSIKSV